MRGVSRRAFLATLAAASPALARPGEACAGLPGTRVLAFSHTHTGERLSVEYCTGGQYVPDAIAAINHLLRDFRTNEIHEIDPALLDLLAALAGVTQARTPFQVISAYRSPATNAMLRQKGEGVAAGSLHMVGQAIDFRVAGVRLPALRTAAVSLARGGVGYYPASDFVHVDTGRVRTW
jgi:uncharacterized protein YcbK (DUF882 family)